jgi:hypothetical protein
MEYTVNLLKMRTKINNPVDYFLELPKEEIYMNELIGKKISLKWLGEIHCISCGNKTNKSFAQGFCYPCFMSVPEAAPCIIRPELCEAHKGIARDMQWSEKNCLSDHYVYLSLTSGIKVGVTRASQIPFRWIDQGALKAVKLAKTPNRFTAGLIETRLKKIMSDKTSWQRMLKNDVDRETDMLKHKADVKEQLSPDTSEYFDPDDTVLHIEYPVEQYPEKVKSINLENTPSFEKTLRGIKGQYLIFDDQTVINIRKYNGYRVELSF